MDFIQIGFFALTGLAWIYFLVQFIKERRLYKFVVLVWVPVSWLSYVFKTPTALSILSTIQTVLFILLIVSLFKKPAPNEEEEQQAFNETNENENIVELPDEEYEELESGEDRVYDGVVEISEDELDSDKSGTVQK